MGKMSGDMESVCVCVCVCVYVCVCVCERERERKVEGRDCGECSSVSHQLFPLLTDPSKSQKS